ncbi:ArsR/SmtB family transcription factor [Aurantiacibacter rhizosphaerae]|uniref:Metalloregulator ArsR/SmtB family transcription factor n=1 Tax=Aurantiacibacter rhizosphaerae TaxID=2691582 RepID=A0A844XGJ9_9SPHN|nr:metalloregulator ArsR/SmtB family transcription factor [Aurantiacibacter rhizosphaerae]MWV28950.1 metalloregulator ArsR/SmtB family transcription factor [Aurantiacibacter rhizosphaerae]
MRIEPVVNALADSTRLRIMRLLEQLELAVGELAHVLGQSQPRVSRHVAILSDSGLAQRRREGSWAFVRKAVFLQSDNAINAAVAHLLDGAEAEDAEFAAQCAEDRRRLAAIRSMREESAKAFFASHANEWDQLRALLSPSENVEAAMLDALGDAPLGRLLDIGTGTGRIAELLSDRAEHVVGLDRSPEMLRLARARLQHLSAARWELVQGDFYALGFVDETFDTVILHQVLHYAQEPAYAIREAARVCRKGGRLVIVDLAAHENDDLRKRHAHVRLGFAEEQMKGFLAENGLSYALHSALEGDALTTKVWVAQKDC